MDIFKYFMTYLGAAILILCLAFSGIQSATIKRVTSESAMAGHSTGVFENDNALQSLAAGNILSNPSELLEFNQEVESILETGDEYFGSLEKHLNQNIDDVDSVKMLSYKK